MIFFKIIYCIIEDESKRAYNTRPKKRNLKKTRREARETTGHTVRDLRW